MQRTSRWLGRGSLCKLKLRTGAKSSLGTYIRACFAGIQCTVLRSIMAKDGRISAMENTHRKPLPSYPPWQYHEVLDWKRLVGLSTFLNWDFHDQNRLPSCIPVCWYRANIRFVERYSRRFRAQIHQIRLSCLISSSTGSWTKNVKCRSAGDIRYGWTWRYESYVDKCET